MQLSTLPDNFSETILQLSCNFRARSRINQHRLVIGDLTANSEPEWATVILTDKTERNNRFPISLLKRQCPRRTMLHALRSRFLQPLFNRAVERRRHPHVKSSTHES
jgi:hypothetical protein